MLIKLSFVDFGIVGIFDENLKDSATNLFCGVVKNDIDMVIDKLDILVAGQTVDTCFLIERFIGTLEDLRRDDLIEIDRAINADK